MTVEKLRPQRRTKGFQEIAVDAGPEMASLRQPLLSALDHALAGATGVERDRLSEIRGAVEAYGAAPPGPEAFAIEPFEMQELLHVEPHDYIRYLCYRFKYKMFPKRRIAEGFPPSVQIEPASVCNYRCIMCYQVDQTFTKTANGHMGLMPLDLFTSVVDQLQGNCEAVTLASRGEPLMNPRIEEMLAYAAGKFLGLKVNTNAYFLNERLSHALLSADVAILVFSADAADKALYEEIRVRGDFDRVTRNIDLFQSIRDKHYPRARTLTRVSGVKLNDKQQLADMNAHWAHRVDQVAFVQYRPWESSYENPVNDISEPCSELWRRMFVWVDGRVNPCDYDYKSTLCVGNAKTERLLDIWTGPAYQALRGDHLNGRRHSRYPCQRCVQV